jgi:hypothetical protein
MSIKRPLPAIEDVCQVAIARTKLDLSSQRIAGPAELTMHLLPIRHSEVNNLRQCFLRRAIP